MPEPPSPSETVSALRRRLRTLAGGAGRRASALRRAAAIWQSRLDSDWTPPAGSPFPWAQVRRSLAALIPGMQEATETVAEDAPARNAPVLALILAGNTPLLAWLSLFYAVLTGCAVFVKMSRDETLWPRLFVETLAEADPEVAALIHLDVWPGDDPRTVELVQSADAVIAYGSDTTIAALRDATPPGVPFYGFGHAISIGIWSCEEWVKHLQGAQFRGSAVDTLMYGQGGCLSLHGLFVRCAEDGEGMPYVVDGLVAAFTEGADTLDVPPVTDPAVARAVREARDMALFEGAIVRGADDLRWTIIGYPSPRPLPAPVGHCVLPVIPVRSLEEVSACLGPLESKVSAVSWMRLRDLHEAWSWLRNRDCYRPPVGGMQTPPLDWRNGGVDFYVELQKIASGEAS